MAQNLGLTTTKNVQIKKFDQSTIFSDAPCRYHAELREKPKNFDRHDQFRFSGQSLSISLSLSIAICPSHDVFHCHVFARVCTCMSVW